MKKIGLLAIVLALMTTICACGRKEEQTPTQPQSNTQPSTVAPTIMPEIDPTLDTNIPDPTVNENSQGMGVMENNSTNDSTDASSGTENSNIGTDNNQNGLDSAARNRMFQK